MIPVKVTKVNTAEKEDNVTEYSIVLKGTYNMIEVSITLKSLIKEDLEDIVPLKVDEQRKLSLQPINKTLDQYHEEADSDV